MHRSSSQLLGDTLKAPFHHRAARSVFTKFFFSRWLDTTHIWKFSICVRVVRFRSASATREPREKWTKCVKLSFAFIHRTIVSFILRDWGEGDGFLLLFFFIFITHEVRRCKNVDSRLTEETTWIWNVLLRWRIPLWTLDPRMLQLRGGHSITHGSTQGGSITGGSAAPTIDVLASCKCRRWRTQVFSLAVTTRISYISAVLPDSLLHQIFVLSVAPPEGVFHHFVVSLPEKWTMAINSLASVRPPSPSTTTGARKLIIRWLILVSHGADPCRN